ncbi:2-amino-4-hydroxy-6-hydroxymethyldihydropteridine diphosphokinase [Cyanobacterium sp. uoEpiScrs1]|uniref:2-amino-4-hydroxy-6- hydroxymethyldihydropteridine diphosphokinase n=1 Tax=Cyanobacterium sp. uoEpiScrs1 TaxID=2976343 RepID=UPI00226AFD0A|nr:2-amino-4-hydroxy-6-hydroxymethyldihydropteridine diphosphokinase [Cyanobacterium sp. uoEpiScrs1]
MKNIQCAVALGSNLGNSFNILEETIHIFRQLSEVYLKSYSHWYETVPIGPPQPNYLNGCAILETYLAPDKLLEILFKIEQQWGRVHRERWGPRTLDLDLLLYGDLILETDILTVPHPHMTRRGFVLVPLAEISPHWVHPVSKKKIIQLLDKVDCSGVNLYQTN